MSYPPYPLAWHVGGTDSRSDARDRFPVSRVGSVSTIGRRFGPLAALLGAQALILAAFFEFSPDDAFITARFAENLVDGKGLVFNAGERVSALTSPLHALIEALLYLATGATLLWDKILGIAVVQLAFLVALRSLRPRPVDRWLFAVVVLPSPFIHLWSVGGLGTPYLLALVTGMVVLVRSCDEGVSAGRAAAISTLLGLCFVTRYDSVVFVAPALVHLMRKAPRRAAPLILPGLAIALAWMGFSYGYFHDVFPTTAYVKAPEYTARRLAKGLPYLAQFLVVSGLAILALLTRRPGRPAAGRGWLWLGIALVFGYGLGASTLHMMFSYRLFVPYIPAMALAVLDLRAAPRPWMAPGRGLGALSAGLLLLHLGLLVVMEYRSLNPGFVGDYRGGGVRAHNADIPLLLEEAAGAIRSHWEQQPASDRRRPRIRTFAAGVVPYYYREAYIYEYLVSYRKRCKLDYRRSCDYVVIMDRPGRSLRGTLGEPPEKLERIFSRPHPFFGPKADLRVYFRSAPEPHRLPPVIDQPCRERPFDP